MNEVNSTPEVETKNPDVVKVVRCKQCMFFTKKSGWCELHLSRMTDKDFCSYGRKK